MPLVTAGTSSKNGKEGLDRGSVALSPEQLIASMKRLRESNFADLPGQGMPNEISERAAHARRAVFEGASRAPRPLCYSFGSKQ